MTGPKPKPTRLKELAGNPGKRSLNKREPKPRVVFPRCPPHLDAGARKEWHRLGRELGPLRMITAVDMGALAAYCQLYSRWVVAEESLAATGMLIKTSNGNVIQNPLVGIVNRTMELMLRHGAEFGLTPASRTRLEIPAEVEEDEFTAFLRGKG